MNRCRSCQGDQPYKTRTCYLWTTLARLPMIRLPVRTISGPGNQRASASDCPPLERLRNGRPVTSVGSKGLPRLAGPKLGGCEDQGEECARGTVEAEVTNFEEDHRIPIRRPRGSGCPRLSGGAGGNSFGAASFCRNYIQVDFFSRHSSIKGNLPTIRRPLRPRSLEWGNSQ